MRAHYSEPESKFEAQSSKSETNSNDRNFNVLNESRAKTLIQGVIVILALVIGLCACAGKSASSKFYVLSPLSQSKLSGAEGIAIGVYPISMADYLDRPQIVTRVNDNELNLDEFNRWAEPLKENFYTVLVDNLATLLNSNRVVKTAQRLRLSPMAFQVGVEVMRFDGTLGGDVVLSVKWGLFEDDGKKLLLAKRSSFSEPTGAATYEALVAAESRAVAAFSREIAEAVKAGKQ